MTAVTTPSGAAHLVDGGYGGFVGGPERQARHVLEVLLGVIALDLRRERSGVERANGGQQPARSNVDVPLGVAEGDLGCVQILFGDQHVEGGEKSHPGLMAAAVEGDLRRVDLGLLKHQALPQAVQLMPRLRHVEEHLKPRDLDVVAIGRVDLGGLARSGELVMPPVVIGMVATAEADRS